MEQKGMVSKLTRCMLDQALSRLARWDKIHPGLFMSLNLSAQDVQKPVFIDQLKGLLEETGLAPSSIVLEITETELLSDWQQAAHTIAELKKMGVKLALDDFGTGYSSLSYLNRFRASKLKIDRSFVHAWSQTGGTQLLRAIVHLGHNMGMKVVAEGVERKEELHFLQSLGCDYYQGYLSAKPMFAEEIERDQWLESGHG
ncbi:MAG: EAL domain-containing protein (putative c-di-GMP-specific phosphodiesterase class I) [Halopseudomonas sp.]|jgi:EAL domain-containing protein (putative c-di-GMP-specific phosphodiesterase class I)